MNHNIYPVGSSGDRRLVPLAIDPATPAVAPWRAAQQRATDAAWLASGLVSVAPYCVSQQVCEGDYGVYVGNIHYETYAGLLEFTAAHGAEVSATPVRDMPGYSVYRAAVMVRGVEVRAWTTAPDAAGRTSDTHVSAVPVATEAPEVRS